MRTESQEKRYRDGYAAGQRDGRFESGVEEASQQRVPNADADSNAGYAAGFAERRRTTRQSANVFSNVPWLAQVSDWIKRRGTRSR